MLIIIYCDSLNSLALQYSQFLALELELWLKHTIPRSYFSPSLVDGSICKCKKWQVDHIELRGTRVQTKCVYNEAEYRKDKSMNLADVMYNVPGGGGGGEGRQGRHSLITVTGHRVKRFYLTQYSKSGHKISILTP